MIKLPRNLSLTDKGHKAIFDSVCIQAHKILNDPLHAHYTDHSIAHSQRIIDLVSKIIDAMKDPLIEEERFVLLCAIVLHDIGMQAPNLADFSSSLPLTEIELEKIRIKHHEYSEELILKSVQLSNDNKFYLGLEGRKEFIDNIALIAKCHRKINLALLEDDVIGSKTIRMKLLASLIRLGDSLDLDFRRVKIERLKIFNISAESKFHWFCHHYIHGLNIERQKINIYFSFPKRFEIDKVFADVMLDHVKHSIASQVDEVYDVLDFYGIRIHKDIVTNVKYTDSKEALPRDLEGYILSFAQQKGVYRGVIYGKLNILTRKDLVNSYIQLLSNTQSFRNMLVGPNFLSPKWYRQRVSANKAYGDFDSLFYDFLLDACHDTVNSNIKLILTNTDRYTNKIRQHLTMSERRTFINDVLQNVSVVWGKKMDKGPLLCCVDPGYMHIITASDSCAVITQRLSTFEPTSQGYLISDQNEIDNVKNQFDQLFEFNYTSQSTELGKLISFVESVGAKIND